MANPHSTPKSPISRTERRYHVRYRPLHEKRDVPMLNISGLWLKEVGFDIGKGFTVKVMNGCLVLIADTDRETVLSARLKQVQCAVKNVKTAIAV
ncbi:type I toxin-antitoxin system SymE family toxin [Leminorella grimontii]|uniref:SymE family type I addiction module toxin n=1 Tax=Leminorella grimontii TaxID=82981 RepID=UPI0020856117|nr:type I toxin-antitoxin system SymE family toxin [Leminorella grimontii]GKX60143.1 hypothetical protein SOASR031_24580 [Leminorella grimontii]